MHTGNRSSGRPKSDKQTPHPLELSIVGGISDAGDALVIHAAENEFDRLLVGLKKAAHSAAHGP